MMSTPHQNQGAVLPSPCGRGAGGEGKPVVPRKLLDFARDLRRQQTDTEQFLWRLLRDRALQGYKFRRQHPIPPFIADFYCHEARLIVELDGGQHDQRQDADLRRTRHFESKGIRVLRFWNHEVFQETEAVLETILQALTAISPPAVGQGDR
jgi:very-short-patch-repair endonuclease